ncbi:MAG TPA: Ig-like domain-containing protein [Bacteroidota bacterium]|nr:Ig-like domain-containing protein [Bacteroidota bacterium]
MKLMKNYCWLIVLAAVIAGCDSNPTSSLQTSGSTNVPPSVVWTDPWPGAIGPNIMSPGNVVIIRFNTLMNTYSVIHAVSISPSNSSVFIDTTRAAPVEGTTFDFPLTPTPLWLAYVNDASLDSRFPASYQIYYPYFAVGQQYTISIGPSTEDIYGDTLGSTVTFSFTPEPYFRVMDSYPMNGDTAISPINAGITLRFNAPVDTGSVAGAFSISPSVTGATSVYYGYWGLSWNIGNATSLASETKYTATVAASVKDVNGHALTAPYSLSFTTAPYEVTYGYPTGNGVSTTAQIYISCNFLIDSTTIASSFSIAPAVAGSINFGGSGFTFAPSSALAPGTTYVVTVSTGLKAKNGTPMKNPYTFSFVTGF